MHKYPVLRKSGGLPRTNSKLFYREHLSLFPVLFAALKTHHVALGAGREDQTPATRMMKWHVGGSSCHHTRMLGMVSLLGGPEAWLTKGLPPQG